MERLLWWRAFDALEILVYSGVGVEAACDFVGGSFRRCCVDEHGALDDASFNEIIRSSLV